MSEDRKRVLITGGAGFIGSHVAESLLRRGDYVIVVDDMNDYYDTRLKFYNLSLLKSCYPSSSFAVYNGDIVDRQLMTEIFEKEKPTHVCHLAARAGVRPSISDPYIYVRTNIEGTTCLLDLSRTYGIQNFVYASSSSVYGGSDKATLSEDDVINKPVSPYAATKATCELLAYTFFHLYGMNSIGLRFFTVYGPRGRPDMAPFKFIDRITRGVPIQQYGDGSTSRDYTYISDIVDGVIRSLDRPMGCEVINLGNGNPFLLKNFIDIVERAVGKKAVIEYLPEQPGDVERTCANLTKARMLLDYNPQVSFEDGIAQTVDWYKFFFSVIFPGGNVGSAINSAPDPIAKVSWSPPGINPTEKTESKAVPNPPHQLTKTVARRRTDVCSLPQNSFADSKLIRCDLFVKESTRNLRQFMNKETKQVERKEDKEAKMTVSVSYDLSILHL